MKRLHDDSDRFEVEAVQFAEARLFVGGIVERIHGERAKFVKRHELPERIETPRARHGKRPAAAVGPLKRDRHRTANLPGIRVVSSADTDATYLIASFASNRAEANDGNEGEFEQVDFHRLRKVRETMNVTATTVKQITSTVVSPDFDNTP